MFGRKISVPWSLRSVDSGLERLSFSFSDSSLGFMGRRALVSGICGCQGGVLPSLRVLGHPGNQRGLHVGSGFLDV